MDEEIRKATTEREYLLILARELSSLNDPHLYFDAPGYYRSHGVSVQPAFRYVSGHGGHYWLALGPEHIVHGDIGPPETDPQLYELVSVDGVFPPLATQMLLLAPDEHADALVLDKDGRERHVTLRGSPPKAEHLHEVPFSWDRIRARVPEFAQFTQNVHLGYVCLNGFDEQIRAQLERDTEEIFSFDVVVIDLRQNHGGNLSVVKDVLSRFLTRPTPFAVFEYREAVSIIGGNVPVWFQPLEWVLPYKQVYRKPVVVLIDTETTSGGELLAMALKDIRGARLVGHRTAGGGGIIGRITLPDGLTVIYTRARFRRLDGRAVQRVGIEPDVTVDLDYDAIMNRGEDALNDSMDRVIVEGYRQAARLLLSAHPGLGATTTQRTQPAP